MSTPHAPSRAFGRGASRLLFVLLGGPLAQGCGDSVNLGAGAEHWFDGDAAHGGSTTEPVRLYEGTKYPLNFAVDETTIYVSFIEGDVDSRLAVLKACELASCASTLRVVHQQAF